MPGEMSDGEQVTAELTLSAFALRLLLEHATWLLRRWAEAAAGRWTDTGKTADAAALRGHGPPGRSQGPRSQARLCVAHVPPLTSPSPTS